MYIVYGELRTIIDKNTKIDNNFESRRTQNEMKQDDKLYYANIFHFKHFIKAINPHECHVSQEVTTEYKKYIIQYICLHIKATKNSHENYRDMKILFLKEPTGKICCFVLQYITYNISVSRMFFWGFF